MHDVVGGVSPLLNPGFRRMFRPGRLTLGLFFPIESFEGDRPAMRGQEALARRAEELGYAALWFRDVPLRDPAFGDVGQVYDPWVYLGYVAAQTHAIALATGAIVLPLRHPLHTAKAAASVDRLSGGRLVLGVASGDRAAEFPAFARDLDARGGDFRENLCLIRRALSETFPAIDSPYGRMVGLDLVPKPVANGLPILVTGGSGQATEWTAQHSDGWVTYPRPLPMQAGIAQRWRQATQAAAPGVFKPFAQSLYVDLAADPDEGATPIHLGYRLGRHALSALLGSLEGLGVHHVALNLKYGRRSAGDVVEEIGEQVLPEFASHDGASAPFVKAAPAA